MVKNLHTNLRRAASRAVAASTIFFMLAPNAFAATYYWTGFGADGSRWENANNWSTADTPSGNGAVPTQDDVAIFRHGGSVNPVVRSRAIAKGIVMDAAWTGSIMMGTGTLAIGPSGWRAGGGTFVGGTSPITLSGSLTQTGGTLKGLMDTLSVSGSLSITGAASTFTSTGTVVFASAIANQTFTPAARSTFRHLTIYNRGAAGANAVTIATGHLNLSGSLTVTQGKLDLTTNSRRLAVRKNVTVASSTVAAIVTNSNVALSGSLTVSNASGGFLQTAGTTNFKGSGPQSVTLGGGLNRFFTVTLNSTSDISGQYTVTAADHFNMSGSLTITTGLLNLATNSKRLVARGITVASSALAGLVTDSNVTNSGAVSFGVLSTLTVTGGTWKQNGTQNVNLDFAGRSVNNLTINNPGIGTETETLLNPLFISGALTVTDGTLDTQSNNIRVVGNTLIAGTLVARGATIRAAGNWTKEAAGTFTANTGSVILNGTAQTLSGSTTFYVLTKNITSAETLQFAQGRTTTATTLTLQGTAGAALKLRSTTAGQKWTISTSSPTVAYLNVQDSTASTTIACSNACTDAGNNTGWDFAHAAAGGSATTTGGGGGRGGGGGGGGGKIVLPSTPAKPATPANPATGKVKGLTLKERLAQRRKLRLAFQARLKARLEERRARRGM